jgi:hypothetical protein
MFEALIGNSYDTATSGSKTGSMTAALPMSIRQPGRENSLKCCFLGTKRGPNRKMLAIMHLWEIAPDIGRLLVTY